MRGSTQAPSAGCAASGQDGVGAEIGRAKGVKLAGDQQRWARAVGGGRIY